MNLNQLAARDKRFFALEAERDAKKRQLIESYNELVDNSINDNSINNNSINNNSINDNNDNPYLAEALKTYETIFDNMNKKTEAKLAALKRLLADKHVLNKKDRKEIKREIAELKQSLL